MKNKLIILFGIIILAALSTSIIIFRKNISAYDASILIVGDNMLARSIGEEVESGKDPYQYVKDDLKKYDLVVANLECVITDKGKPIPEKDYILNAPVKSIDVIKNSGIDLLSLANNHSMDMGDEGFLDMLDKLNTANIPTFGGGITSDDAYKYKLIRVNGTAIAMITYNEINTWYTKPSKSTPGSMVNDMSKIAKLIQSAKSEADLVIIVPHWGEQYDLTQNKEQVAEAHQLIDNGADLVVGSHPYVVQGHEAYKNKDTFYSLGNFLFVGNNMDKVTTKGYGLEIYINDRKIVGTNLREVVLDKDTGYPRFIN